jgi:hypothetical protein
MIRSGITETELERIYSAYRNLLLDEDKEIISKKKLRQVHYLSMNEKEAIIR